MAEIGDDLNRAGFRDVEVARQDPGMNAVVIAAKP